MVRYLYPLDTDMVARLRLDEDAARYGREDARVLDGTFDVRAYADELACQQLDGREDVTDDKEEYRARFVDAYTSAFLTERSECEV